MIVADLAILARSADDAPSAGKSSGSLIHGLLPRAWAEHLVCDLPVGHAGSRLQGEEDLLLQRYSHSRISI